MSRKEMIVLVLIAFFLLLGFSAYKSHAGEDYMPEDGNWVGKPPDVAPRSYKDKIKDQQVQMFCFSYIKKLKGMWYEINKEGAEALLRAHPPEDEGVSMEYARRIATEIEGIDSKHAQAWIEVKWNECVTDPLSVGK